MLTQETTPPLLLDHPGLPLHTGSTRTHDSAPILVPVCHSTLSWPSQRELVLVRLSILAHLTGPGPLLVRGRILERIAARQASWSIIFDFTTVSFILHWLWYFFTFLSSLRHYRQSALDDDNDQHWLTRLIVNVTPANRVASSRDRFDSSLLYNTAHVFNLINTFMFWTVLVPRGYGHFGPGWLGSFSAANIYAVTMTIALNELMFWKIFTHEQDASSQVLSIFYLLVGCLGLAAIGHAMTGRYAFFWMDPEEMRSCRLVAACSSGFVCMCAAAFATLHGFTSLRKNFAHGDRQEDGYTRVEDSDDEEEQPSLCVNGWEPVL